MKYWLAKSEPDVYSWQTLIHNGKGFWDGVRSYAARKNLLAMEAGDLLLFYHSNVGKEIVGIARVISKAYQDPTTSDERWVGVDVEPLQAFKKSVTLAQIKAEKQLQDFALVRQSRLSVMPVSDSQLKLLLRMGETVI